MAKARTKLPDTLYWFIMLVRAPIRLVRSWHAWSVPFMTWITRVGSPTGVHADQLLHALLAHVAERHRRAGRVLGLRQDPVNEATAILSVAS